jgi:hypothetical protein
MEKKLIKEKMATIKYLLEETISTYDPPEIIHPASEQPAESSEGSRTRFPSYPPHWGGSEGRINKKGGRKERRKESNNTIATSESLAQILYVKSDAICKQII